MQSSPVPCADPSLVVWADLALRYQGGDLPAWLDWLRAPHELAEILAATPVIRVPVTDVRVRPFLVELFATPHSAMG